MSTIAILFKRDYERYEGVRRINIYALRIGYLLVFTTVGFRSWSTILRHPSGWDPLQAAAVSMWAAHSVLSVFGLISPLRWLPLVLFEIAYKIIWLIVVAFPLWSARQLWGSPAENLTWAFLPVIVPVVLVPWGYVFRRYLWPRRVTSAS
jgi:hypothetical protein